jgi:hypothetical protein
MYSRNYTENFQFRQIGKLSGAGLFRILVQCLLQAGKRIIAPGEQLEKMKNKSNIRLITFLFGPWMILPLAFTIAFIFGGIIYEWPEFSRNYEQYIFFQGNIDMGGACLFAGVLLLYLFFGFTAGWYLVLKLEEVKAKSFSRIVANGLLILKYHILAFVVGSTINLGYDARVAPNDFRNMFLLAGLLYSLSFLNICILHKLSVV